MRFRARSAAAIRVGSAWIPVAALCLLAAAAHAESTWQQDLDELQRTPERLQRIGLAERISSQDVPLQELLENLRRPPSFDGGAPTGELHWGWVDDRGRTHRARVHVPTDYDPGKSYPVYVYLHGSVQRPPWAGGEVWWPRWQQLVRDDRIVVFPAAWEDARWWHEVKVQHLAALLERLRATYNVDPDRCVLSGVSDGGTGTWYQALNAPTPWACFLPFIGHPSVLNLPEERASGEQWPVNLSNRAFFVINGRDDHLYPAASLEAYFSLFRRAGAELELRIHDGGHDVRNWPQEWRAMEQFIADRPRDPLPDRLRWRTDDPRRSGRFHWVIIDRLGPSPGDRRNERFSVIDEPDENGVPRKMLAFKRDRPSGQLDVSRAGNIVEVQGELVAVYRLLLSPDEFDLSSPVIVLHSGRTVWAETVIPSADTLLKWFARDLDRSQLFVGELRVDARAGTAQLVDARGPATWR